MSQALHGIRACLAGAARPVSGPAQDGDLLDDLPILEDIAITKAPESVQRKLYDAIQLQVHYDRPDQARIRMVLTEDNTNALVAATAGATITEIRTNSAHRDQTPPGAHRTWAPRGETDGRLH